jgi:1,2-diacylglycerol 3-alpha-glucosyltransferase
MECRNSCGAYISGHLFRGPIPGWRGTKLGEMEGSGVMDIVMFTETFLPHANGVTTSLLNARDALKRRGHKVTIYSAGPPLLDAADVHFYGGKIFNLYPDFPVALYPSRRSIKNNRRVRREPADLVHVHCPGPMGWRGYKASKELKVPLILTHHTLLEPLVRYAPIGWKTIYRAGSRFITKKLVKNAATLIAPSTATRDELTAAYPEAGPKIRVVPTGIDTERFHPGLDAHTVREDWGFDERHRVVLYLGRVSYEKRIDVLLDAFQRLHQKEPLARFVIAGTGPANDELQEQAKRLGVDDVVRFEGHVPGHRLPLTYAAADAFASASEVETQGLTLLEAMAVGKPCAVTAYRGYLDFVRDGENGFLFQKADADHAARALRAALDAPANVRTNARRTAEQFSTQACVRMLENVYNETVN